MFENSLIDLETAKRPRGRRWISLPIAVALHLVGLTAFAFASYWNVGAVAEPTYTNAVFFDLVPLPAPPGGGGGGPTKPVTDQPVTEVTKPNQPVQPDVVRDLVPASTTTTPANDILDVDPGDSTGDDSLPPGPGFGPGPAGPGVGPGPGGDGDGPSIGPGVENDQPIRFSVGMTRPVPIRQVQPRYSEVARRAGIQGTVVVEAIIDEQGNVDNVRVLRGLPMGLDKAAIEAIQQWRFTPATMANKPIKVYFTLTVNFTIQR